MPSNFVDIVSVESGIDWLIRVHPRIKSECPINNSIKQNSCISSNIPLASPIPLPIVFTLIKNDLCKTVFLSRP